MDATDMQIKAVSYTALMKLLKRYSDIFNDKEQVQLVRDAADAVFFEPRGKQTPVLTQQCFEMLKHIGMQSREGANELAEIITAMQRLVSYSGGQLPPGRPSELHAHKPLTGFDRWRAGGEHII